MITQYGTGTQQDPYKPSTDTSSGYLGNANFSDWNVNAPNFGSTFYILCDKALTSTTSSTTQYTLWFGDTPVIFTLGEIAKSFRDYIREASGKLLEIKLIYDTRTVEYVVEYVPRTLPLPFYTGTTQAKDIYVGTSKVKAIYRGTTEIWPSQFSAILVGGASGRYALLSDDGSNVIQTWKDNVIGTSATVRNFVKLNNGNILVLGSICGILSADCSTVIATDIYPIGSGNECYCGVVLDNGKVLVGGTFGRYSILSADGLTIDTSYKTDAISTNQINRCIKLNNGTILLAGNAGGYAVLASNGLTVSQAMKQDVLSTGVIWALTKLSNGNISVAGLNGRIGILSSDASTVVLSYNTDAIETNALYSTNLIGQDKLLIAGAGSYIARKTADGITTDYTLSKPSSSTTVFYTTSLLKNGNTILCGANGTYWIVNSDGSETIQAFKTDALDNANIIASIVL